MYITHPPVGVAKCKTTVPGNASGIIRVIVNYKNAKKLVGISHFPLYATTVKNFSTVPLWRYSPPLTWTSYREYLGDESILMSGRNFSASVSITSCVVAVLDTRMHLVAKFPATLSWK